jgi:hypothetical protein
MKKSFEFVKNIIESYEDKNILNDFLKCFSNKNKLLLMNI